MLGLELIEGEAMVKSFTNIEVTVSEGEKQECILASTKGSLLLTNYRLVLLNLQSKPEEVYGIFPIPLAAISNLEIRKHENARIIEVQCKDHRYQRISINPYNDSDNPEDILKALKKNIFPKKLSVRFAFHNKECKVSAEQNGWGLYNPVKEFQRYNISSKYWRECKINQKYKFCASYPATFYVPINVSDKQLIQIAEFRNEGRIPILCWKSPETNATLTRCARQFKRLDRDLIYMSGNNEDADEAIFRGIADSNGGQEVTYFKDFPELDLKESLMRLRALCSHYTSIMKTGEIVNDATWDERLKKTRWLSVGMSLLKYSGKIVAELEAGHSIVVESSDGRDSVSQLISLALLCLDPYYRTITGFAVLVEKEWLSAGHFFGQRSSKKAADHSLSAVFIQFLDCVWQIWDQYPRAFEFNENFLLFLAESVHSSRFGTFLLDCEKQKYADKLREKTPSVWSYTMLHVDRFKNENYPGDSKERILRPRPSAVKLWQQYYLQTTSQLILSRLQPGKPEIKKDATMELSGQTLLEWPVEMLKKADSHRALNISHNKLNNIPISIIPYLRELKVIDLSHNDLTYLSGQFLDLLGKSAEGSIVIRSPSRGSKRSSKSDEKDKLKTVLVCKTQVLDLTANKIISIPLPISNLRGLKWLLLSHNHLGSLPASVGKLTKLRRLHLAHNRLLKLPPELVSLVRLEELVLDHNKLPSLPSDLLKSMPHLQVLTLENNELTSLPVQEFSGFSRLRALKIGGNPFAFSSSEICSLLGDVSRSGETLRDLSLNGIQLGSYTPVTAPSTPSSSASSAPSSIFQFLRTCKAIKTLDLSNTMIVKDVPEEIFGLSGLTCLKLSNNHICVLPTSISKLEKLEELHLQQNDLQTLPPDVGRLQRLRILDVADNKDLEAIPSQLGYLNLAVLNISGTKALSRFPKEMQAKGHEAMMAYLRLALEGTVDINRMKLMIVGQENVGKTTLITMLKKRLHKKKKLLNTMGSSSGVLPLITSSEKLRRGTSAMNISTDGIDISELQVPLDEARGKATLSVWDFAGQELYYSTHQFFLSDKSLYLLAFNLVDGDEDGRVEYWLQSVAARAGDDAAVILVGTHLDDSSCTQEYLSILTEQLYEKYHRDRPRQGSPRVKWNFGFSHLLFVDCVTGNGIETLIQLLTEVLQGQKHITQTLPSTFLELEKSIVAKRATLNPPILQWAEFADMASLCHIKEERQIAIAAEILHNLGSLLHFEDKELKDLVVIHPQWLTRVMSSIITTKHNYARAGILRHNTLRQIWREPQFPESVHAFLLSLLNRFEISFDLPTEEMTLIPALLDDARPNEVDSLWSLIFQKESSIVRWQDEKKSSQTGSTRRSRKHKTSFGRYYTFDFIPNGLFGRLIVRLLALQKAANIKVLHYWRSGVLVCINHVHRDTLILVELMSKERTITVMVRSLRGGRDVNRSWGTILLAISSLISEWYKLEADIQVPCSHCLEGLAEPYIFPLTTCQQAVISGGGYVYCQGEVQVRLDHVAPDLVMSHLSHKLVNYDDVLLYEELGHGSFATVHRSTYKGEVVAVKRFSFDSPDNTITEEAKIKAFEEFRHEISIMTGLEHPNILKMIGFCLHPVCLVTEYIANGNLYQYIHRLDEPDSDPDAPPKPIIEWNGMSWPLRLKVAKDIAKGMAFLHDLTPPVIHSDLKSPNILLADLSAEAHVVAKVCDFGVSNNVAWSIIGTQVENPVWLAPEVLKGEEYTTKADVYAYGVILWEMLTGQQFMSHIPFMSLIEKSIIAGERSDLPSTCQVPEYVKLIQDCWQDSALHRPSFGEVVLRLMGIMEQSQPQEIATYDEEVIQEIVEKKKKDRVLALHALPAFQYFERLAAETHKWTPPPKESKK